MNQVLQGDCLSVLQTLTDCSVDAIVSDPPAGIAFMNKNWDKDKGGKAQWVAWMTDVARECLRVMKPGGHALVWAIPRTSHWTGDAWENAGWQPRDKIYHCFGSGFPKSHNLDGDWDGWGSALKPAIEEWWLFRKPLQGTLAQNVQEHGTGGLNIDGCRVGTDEVGKPREKDPARMTHPDWRMTGGSTGSGASNPAGRWPANLIHSGEPEVVACFPETTSGEKRPEHKRNVPRLGSNAYGNDQGTHVPRVWQGDSGSAARFFKQCPDTDPEDAEIRRLFYCGKATKRDRDEGLEGFEERTRRTHGDTGPSDNAKPNGQTAIPCRNHHPTVKPTPLMQYLCRLITPPGGIIIDPFTGSGSTGKAAVLEGFQFIGIEMEPEYVAIANARIAAAARSEKATLEQRVAWLETQVQAQGAKLRKIEASQQLSLWESA